VEMEFKDPTRRRRMVFVTVGLAVAAVAGLGAFTLASGGQQAAPEVAKRPVLVAAHDVPARTTLAVEDVTIRQVPVDEVLSEAYTEAGLVVGRVTAVSIYTDQQMTPNLFASDDANSDFSILGPDTQVNTDTPYWRAVALQVPAERAVGGQIKAGEHVDLFVSVDIKVMMVDPNGDYQVVDTADQNGLQSGKSTKITYQDVEVLKADPDASMYVLKVDLHQAEQIYHVVQEAPDSFSLALRPDADTRIADSSQYGVTTDRLVMTYLYPVPQLVDLTQLMGGQSTTYRPPNDPGTGTPGVTPAPGATPGPGATPVPSAAPSSSP
jgi:Flp pilus assembly protein CpaB